MKILLVEDLDEKAAQVEAAIRVMLGSKDISLERTRSFRSSIKQLENTTYDVLILDLVLPIRDDEFPSEQGGKHLLAEIVNGSDCRRPSHIICLTAFEEFADILKNEVERNLIHVVFYKETDTSWKNSLEAKIRYVQTRLTEADVYPLDYKTDIAVITSSPLVELAEVTKLSTSFIGEYNQSDALDYYSGNWNTVNGKQLSVVACAAPSMGMTAACVTACKLVDRWRPRFLVMTGIAAGTKKDAEYGDILVAEAAYDYGSGKIEENDNGEKSFIPSPNQLRIDPELHALLQRWERDQLQMDSIRRSWYRDIFRSPRLILGLLASGAAVVQSKELVDSILEKSRKVIGLEMEAYAIFQAAHLARSPRPRVLVAKAISDFADKNKDDNWQQYAAFTSARFIYEFFTNSIELQLGTTPCNTKA